MQMPQLRFFMGGALAGAFLALVYTHFRRRKTSDTEVSLRPRGAEFPGSPVASQGVLSQGKVAVITGAANGIGKAVALKCVERGMKVVLADLSRDELERVRRECIMLGAVDTDVLVAQTDVSKEIELLTLRETAYRHFGKVHFLMNNAGVGNRGEASAIAHLDRWKFTMDVNFFGVLYGCQLFAENMIAQGEPAVIVNTGSKQGITMPPGDTAYNCSKAAVKCLTEGLQHTLRNLPSYETSPVNAFLLVPGWTVSMIGTKAAQRLLGSRWDPSTAQDEQSYKGNRDPDFIRKAFADRGAWTANQVADVLFKAVDDGAPFYIICEDNETTTEMDNMRIQWAADDLINKRVPLSRWSVQYREEFKALASTVQRR